MRHDMSTKARRDLDQTAPNPPAYTFLNVTLDMRRQLLLHGNDEIRLRPRAFDIIRYLVTNAGRLISKQVHVG